MTVSVVLRGYRLDAVGAAVKAAAASAHLTLVVPSTSTGKTLVLMATRRLRRHSIARPVPA